MLPFITGISFTCFPPDTASYQKIRLPQYYYLLRLYHRRSSIYRIKVKDMSDPEPSLLEEIRLVFELLPLTPACLTFSALSFLDASLRTVLTRSHIFILLEKI